MKAEKQQIIISRVDAEVGTVYLDGGFDFDRAILPSEDDLAGYICPHGIYSPCLADRENHCIDCKSIN